MDLNVPTVEFAFFTVVAQSDVLTGGTRSFLFVKGVCEKHVDCSSWLLSGLRSLLIPDVGKLSNSLLRRSIDILSDDPAADPAAEPGAAPEVNTAADPTAAQQWTQLRA